MASSLFEELRRRGEIPTSRMDSQAATVRGLVGTAMHPDQIFAILPPVPEGMNLQDYANYVGFGDMKSVMADQGSYPAWREAIDRKWGMTAGRIRKANTLGDSGVNYTDDMNSLPKYLASQAARGALDNVGFLAGALKDVSPVARDLQQWTQDGQFAQDVNQMYLDSLGRISRERLTTESGRDAQASQDNLAQLAMQQVASLGTQALASGVASAAPKVEAYAARKLGEFKDFEHGLAMRGKMPPIGRATGDLSWMDKVPVQVRMPTAEVVDNPTLAQLKSMRYMDFSTPDIRATFPARTGNIMDTLSPQHAPVETVQRAASQMPELARAPDVKLGRIAKVPDTIQPRVTPRATRKTRAFTQPKVTNPPTETNVYLPGYRSNAQILKSAETQAMLAQLEPSDVNSIKSMLRKRTTTSPKNVDVPRGVVVDVPHTYMTASEIRKFARANNTDTAGVRSLLAELRNSGR